MSSATSLNPSTNAKTFWDKPNQFARPPGIELRKNEVVIHGYQEFRIKNQNVTPLPVDTALWRKLHLVAPYISPVFLTDRTLLDIGANGGFFSFWACQAGARRVVALDMDENYLELIRRAQTHLGLDKIQPVHCRVQDWDEPADVVLAFAMVHWLYSCTAGFGSLEAVLAQLAQLTRSRLLIEWVAPEDPAIQSFKHTDWNPDLVKGPYTVAAFEDALRQHFSRVAIVGRTSPTRVLYIGYRQTNEITLHPALPLLAPMDRVLYSRCLALVNGVYYYSRLYQADSPDRLIKQTTGDLAVHEAQLLERLRGPHFPRVFSAEQRDGYSLLTLEKITGDCLADIVPTVAASPPQVAAFMSECLQILAELAAAGIEHRDIRLDNFIMRQGKPVLLDFGWAQTRDQPYLIPEHMSGAERIPLGPPCDVYSLGRVFQQLVPQNSQLFSPLLTPMLDVNQARGVTISQLEQILRGLPLPGQWDVPVRFPILFPPEIPLPPPPRERVSVGKRIWRRWFS